MKWWWKQRKKMLWVLKVDMFARQDQRNLFWQLGKFSIPREFKFRMNLMDHGNLYLRAIRARYWQIEVMVCDVISWNASIKALSPETRYLEHFQRDTICLDHRCCICDKVIFIDYSTLKTFLMPYLPRWKEIPWTYIASLKSEHIIS